MKSENRYFIFDSPHEVSIKTGILNMYLCIKIACYKLRLKISKKPEIKKNKYNVSLCTIFKNEAKYFKEWIEFHKIVGVDHFYLYNNNSEDDYLSVLQPYIDCGLVTLLQWPKNQAQMECYHDCIDKFSGETKWMGFIDVDEFIVPNSTDTIIEFLNDFERYPAVIIYWKMFGTSGLMEHDPTALITEDFTVSWNKYTDIGKCFYNTAFSFDKTDGRNSVLHHCFWGRLKGKSLPPVNEFGKMCVGNIHTVPKKYDPMNFPIQINHYFTKSYGEYIEKKSKGDVYFKVNPHDMDYFYLHEMKNQSTDHHAYKYLIKLKDAMGKK